MKCFLYFENVILKHRKKRCDQLLTSSIVGARQQGSQPSKTFLVVYFIGNNEASASYLNISNKVYLWPDLLLGLWQQPDTMTFWQMKFFNLFTSTQWWLRAMEIKITVDERRGGVHNTQQLGKFLELWGQTELGRELTRGTLTSYRSSDRRWKKKGMGGPHFSGPPHCPLSLV